MNEVYILSAAGTARELAELVRLSPDYRLLGFLDDYAQGDEVAGALSQWPELCEGGARLLSALGSYKNMDRRRDLLSAIPEERFTAFVHDSVLLYPGADTSAALVVFPYSIVSTGVRVGNHCLVYHGCVLSHDCRLGEFTILANNVTVSGQVEIGENCYLGANCTVNENVRIGNNSIIAAGATVIDDVPEDSIYIAPGKKLPNKYHLSQ